MNTAPTTPFDGSAPVRLAEANAPSSKVLRLPASEPLKLACDQLRGPVSIAYETYGELNAAKSNVVLICHALTCDQYVALSLLHIFICPRSYLSLSLWSFYH